MTLTFDDSVFIPHVEEFLTKVYSPSFSSSSSAAATTLLPPKGVMRRLRKCCAWLAQFRDDVSVPLGVLSAVQRHFEDAPAQWREIDVRTALHQQCLTDHEGCVFRITRQLNRLPVAAFTPEEMTQLVRRTVWLVLAFYESSCRTFETTAFNQSSSQEGTAEGMSELGSFLPVQLLAMQLVHMEEGMSHFAQCFSSSRQDPSLYSMCKRLGHLCAWLNACHDVARLEAAGWGEYSLSWAVGSSWAKALVGTPLDWPLLPAILAAAECNPPSSS